MNDSTIEIVALLSIILGLLIGFLFIFDFEPIDVTTLQEDDNNVFLSGIIIQKNQKENYTLIKIQGCRDFDTYFEGRINKNIGDKITIQGSFTDNFFIIEEYK
ncbi:MAG: hypothetical protein WC758_00470 [Candidatus Woesearchaeota archaeon]|jgi:hypothetical protein